MLSIQTHTARYERRLVQMFWLSVVLIGVLSVAPGRAQAAPVQRLNESEVIQQIQRYCTASWRNASVPRAAWCDCSQQLFCELLQKVPRRHLPLAMSQVESAERRELNRAIWRIIKRQQRSDARSMHPISRHDPTCSVRSKAVDELLAEVIDVGEQALSARQFRILEMTSEGYTIADIAKQLEIPAACASDEKYRGIQRIRECFDMA
jgi:hypothetical protein